MAAPHRPAAPADGDGTGDLTDAEAPFATPTLPGPAVRPVDRDALRARIPGWGVDLDPADRPQFPKLQYRPEATGAHWEVPERQPEDRPRERSIEHATLPPAFGTSVPLEGLSGAVRRYAYRRFSEGRAAHWLLLLAGDRIDAWESHLASFATLRPDNPVTETGVAAEVTHHGLSSRRGRVDARHQAIDPVLVAGPWLAGGTAVVLAVRAVVRRRRRSRR